MTSNVHSNRPIDSQSSSNTNVLDAKTNPCPFHRLPSHWLALFTFFVSRLLVNLVDLVDLTLSVFFRSSLCFSIEKKEIHHES
jgi:hypothetical protein